MSAGSVESDFSPRKLRTAGVCLIGQLFGTSLLAMGALSLIMLPMTREFGWTRTQFSYATSAIMWCGALTSPFLGRLVDRLGVRPVILTGTTIVALATLALAHQTGSLWQFYACFAILGMFGSTAIAYSKVLGALFTQHRGKALALFTVSSTIVASMMPQLTNALLVHFGWRGIFHGFGVMVLAVVVLLYFAMEEPALGKVPPANPAVVAPFKPPALPGLTAAEARRDRIFWTLVASSVFASATGAGWMQHSFAFLIGRGFTQQAVVNVISLSMLISPFGTMLGGWLVDRIQTARIAAPFSVLSALGIVCQMVVSAQFGGLPLLFTSMTLAGAAFGARMPMGTYFYTRFFGMRSFSEILGLHTGILAAVMGFSPPLIGMLFERTGSYNMALLVMLAGHAVSAALILTLGQYRFTTQFGAMPKPAAEPVAEEAVKSMVATPAAE
jgi:MFS family permease